MYRMFGWRTITLPLVRKTLSECVCICDLVKTRLQIAWLEPIGQLCLATPLAYCLQGWISAWTLLRAIVVFHFRLTGRRWFSLTTL